MYKENQYIDVKKGKIGASSVTNANISSEGERVRTDPLPHTSGDN